MESNLITPLSLCRSFGEVAQVLVQAGLYNHDLTGCLIAEIGEDGRIREAGRFGIAGPGPSSESVPLWDEGLIAQAAKKSTPTLIENALEAARDRRLTPSSDIDDLLVLNGFQTVVAIPLRRFGLLNGVIGLCSVHAVDNELKMNFNYKDFQAVMTLATRSVAYSQPAQTPPPKPALTTRDRAVLDLIAKGKTNNEIANELKLSVPTVKLSVSNLLAKLGSSSRHSAAEKAHELGIIG